MKFCNNCDNMYYLKLINEEEEDETKHTPKLVYYCKKCDNVDKEIINDNIVITDTNINKNESQFHHIINEYTKFDPTLPRISNIMKKGRCANGGTGT